MDSKEINKMKSDLNTVSKNIILSYSRKIRDINNTQIEPYMKLIERELLNLFPHLTESDAFDWACDVSNSSNNSEVIEVLNRINSLNEKKVKDSFVCVYCGKNTYEDDIENLMGTNHIGCVLENSIEYKKESKKQNNEELLVLKKAIEEISYRLSKLESKE